MFNSLSILGVKILVFRDDLNHANVSGNKLHKLVPNIEVARARNCSAILSFGGPYSNHLHALAWACKDSGLSSIGVVRGELQKNLTPTLNDCKMWGMKLVPSCRIDYRQYQETLRSYSKPCLANELALESFCDSPGETLVIPEGGSNAIAIGSVASAYKKMFNSEDCKGVTHVVCATGTGATLAGLYQAAANRADVIGIQAVAEGDATFNRISAWLTENPKRLTIEEGHLGKFGKIPDHLFGFIEQFEAAYTIPLDPIYTGKAMLKITQMIEAGEFKKTDTVLFIHTGGLQGKRPHTD